MDTILDWQTLLVFVLVLLGVWLYLTSQLPEGFPKGPRPLPILGNLLLMPQEAKDIQKLTQLSETYGPIVGLKLGSIPAILLNDLDSIKEVFVKHGDAFSARPHYMYLITEVGKKPPLNLVSGVVWTNGETWKQSRRFVLSTLRDFGFGKKSIEVKIQEEADAMCNEFASVAGHPFDPHKQLQKAVSNIICNLCFGSRFEYTDPTFNNLMDMLEENFRSNAFNSIMNFMPYLKFLPKRKWYAKVVENSKNIDKWFEREIEKHRETFDPKEIRDFVDVYLSKENEENSYALSKYNMDRIILDVFATGTETTTTALRWFLLYMIHHTDIQRKVQEELDHVVGQSRKVDLEDRPNMPYMDAVLHETLRLGNIATIAVPHSSDREVTVRGYKIPKDTMVMANIMAVHMDETIWDQPQEFKPERWIDDEGKFYKHESFVPFSVGPRACLGESLARNEMFLFASTMMQRFNVEMADPGNPPPILGTQGLTHAPLEFDVIFKTR